MGKGVRVWGWAGIGMCGWVGGCLVLRWAVWRVSVCACMRVCLCVYISGYTSVPTNYRCSQAIVYWHNCFKCCLEHLHAKVCIRKQLSKEHIFWCTVSYSTSCKPLKLMWKHCIIFIPSVRIFFIQNCFFFFIILFLFSLYITLTTLFEVLIYLDSHICYFWGIMYTFLLIL